MPKAVFLRTSAHSAMCIALCMAIAVPVPAAPSGVEGSITQGAQADRSIERARERLSLEQNGEYALGNDPGVYVLIEDEIFSAGIDVGLGYSSDVDKGSLEEAQSTYTAMEFYLGMDTRIAGSFDAGARVSLSETIFHDEGDFDSGALIGSIYVSDTYFDGTLRLTADATGGLNGGYDFDNGSSYINTSIRASRPIALSESLTLVPSVSAGLVFAEQSEQDRWEVGAQARLIASLSSDTRLTLSAGVTYAEYDDFYEDVLLTGRQDTTSFAGLSLDYAVDENVTASLSVRYTNRTSTLDIVEYEDVDASAMISASARF
jgi:outer membrane protein assembly factor BamB